MAKKKGTWKRTSAKRIVRKKRTDTPTVYESSDLAALLVLMLRNLDENDEATYQSFSDQLANSMRLLPTDRLFTKSLRVIAFLLTKKPGLFDDLHQAVRALLEELEKTQTDLGERWSVCAFISRDQIKQISRL
jgi:hypothetical protein